MQQFDAPVYRWKTQFEINRQLTWGPCQDSSRIVVCSTEYFKPEVTLCLCETNQTFICTPFFLHLVFRQRARGGGGRLWMQPRASRYLYSQLEYSSKSIPKTLERVGMKRSKQTYEVSSKKVCFNWNFNTEYCIF